MSTPEAKLDAARALRAAADWASHVHLRAPRVVYNRLCDANGFCVLGYAIHELEGNESPALAENDTVLAVQTLAAGEPIVLDHLRLALGANDDDSLLEAACHLLFAAKMLEDAAFADAQAEFERPCDSLDSYIDAHEAADHAVSVA